LVRLISFRISPTPDLRTDDEENEEPPDFLEFRDETGKILVKTQKQLGILSSGPGAWGGIRRSAPIFGNGRLRGGKICLTIIFRGREGICQEASFLPFLGNHTPRYSRRGETIFGFRDASFLHLALPK
jgi:hypothetical protein